MRSLCGIGKQCRVSCWRGGPNQLQYGIFRIHQEVEPEKGSENAVITVPADLSAEERGRIQETAKKYIKRSAVEV